MRHAALILALLGAACVAFGAWGLETRAGRAAFDEMAGMIPLFVGVLGGVLLLAAGVCALLAMRAS